MIIFQAEVKVNMMLGIMMMFKYVRVKVEDKKLCDHTILCTCVDLNASCLFYPALERPEGVSQQDYAAMEEFQQRTNAVSLEKVKAYYRRLRYTMLCTASQPSSGLLTHTQDILHLRGRAHPLVLHKQAESTLCVWFYFPFNCFQGLEMFKVRAGSFIMTFLAQSHIS